MDEARLAFDDWLWGFDDARLGELRLGGMQQGAIEAGVRFPQLTAITLMSDVNDAPARLAQGGIGVEDYRPTKWGGLIRAKKDRSTYVVIVWNTEQEGVVHVLASPPWTDSRWRRVETSWVNNAAPDIARVLLNNDEFQAMGDLLAEFGTIGVSRMSARVLADNSSYTRGWPADEFNRHPNHFAALSEVTNGMAVQTLTLAVGDHLSIHLRRQAGATFYSGDFSLFCRTVLDRLAAAAAERRRVLSGHERKVAERISEAIVMTFDAASSDDLRDRVLASLGETSDVRAAVLHGNPYLHLIVTDYLNGSNFDVLVTEEDRLRVLPGFKATASSLARVTDVIGDALGMRTLEVESLLPNPFEPDPAL